MSGNNYNNSRNNNRGRGRGGGRGGGRYSNNNNRNHGGSNKGRWGRDQDPNEKLSRALSWALRHQGPKIGLSMTPDGYVPVAQILKSQHPRLKNNGWTLHDIQQVADSNDKQRFHLARMPAANYPDVPFDDADKDEQEKVLCIRASQGHSLEFIDQELLLTQIPDEELARIPMILHGTYLQAWEIIKTKGLNRMTRNHIHFAPGFPQGKDGVISGMRKTCTVHIYVDAVKCANEPTITFYRSANGVLLTAGVNDNGTLPVEYFSHVTDTNGRILLDQRTTKERPSRFAAAAASMADSNNQGRPQSRFAAAAANMQQAKDDTTSNNAQPTNVAIIVPYRDIHPSQKRASHLQQFIPHMITFLSKLKDDGLIADFHLYILEQSDDGRKFNRGKLLNIGYEVASKKGHDVFIFHDVDLLPNDDLGVWYAKFPQTPLHIARVWDRYSGNKKYFGGVVSFSARDYQRINGFPNTFWGWGGEDDEMQKRCEKLRIRWTAPDKGSLKDLEEMNVEQKVQFLRQNRDWKCNVKWELLDEHAKTWKTNGLSSLKWSLLEETPLDEQNKSTKITVDVQLNGNHWSDQESKL